jgi:CRP-like cAMP-binding protein
MNTTKSLNPIVTFLNLISPLSAKTITDFESIIEFKTYSKGKELLAFNKKATHMYFVAKGLARVYYKRAGKEVSDYFAIDGQFVGAVPSVFNGLPSKKAIHLLEDAEVYFFSIEDFEKCCAKHHDLETAARKVAYYGLVEEQERIESMRFNSVAQRYEELERKYPGITNRCPLKHIATYLGTSQVSISRIRGGNQ